MIEQAINPAEKQINKSAKYFIEWPPVFSFCVDGVLLGLGFCNIFSVVVYWLPWFYFRGVPSIHLRNLMPVIRSTAIWMMSKAKIIIAGMVISDLLVRERGRRQ